MREPQRHEVLATLSGLATDEFKSEEAAYGDEIHDVAGMIGKEVFLRACECEPFSVRLRELELFRGPEGFLWLGRLAGDVTWGVVRWKTVNIDRRQQAREMGFKRIEKFENLLVGVPGSHYQFLLNKIRYHELRVNGHCIAAVTGAEGKDLISGGGKLHWMPNIGQRGDLCAETVEYRCINWACSSSCRVIESDDYRELGDCDCPGYGACAWWTFPRCLTVNCKNNCRLVSYWWDSCTCP